VDTGTSLNVRRWMPWSRLLAGRAVDIVLELIVPVILVVVWWFASARSTSIYFPPLSGILNRFREVWLFDSFSSDAVPTLVNLGVGFVVAVVLAIILGILVGSISLLAEAVAPLLELMRAIPVVALLPVGLLVFGIGPIFQIAMIAFGAIWPVLLNTIDGVQSIDPTVRDVMRTYRLTWGLRLTRVILPTAGPNIIAGMRIALSLSVTVVILSELIGSTEGIGFVIRRAQDQFAIADVWAGIVLLGIIGYVINVLFRGFEYLILRAIKPSSHTTNR
jgi:sulfonate transport system permease protein